MKVRWGKLTTAAFGWRIVQFLFLAVPKPWYKCTLYTRWNAILTTYICFLVCDVLSVLYGKSGSLGFWSQKVVTQWRAAAGALLDQLLSAVFSSDSDPPITLWDRADAGPLNNKGWAKYGWQFAPCQEIICCSFFPSAFSSSHLCLYYQLISACCLFSFQKPVKSSWKMQMTTRKDAKFAYNLSLHLLVAA